MGSDLTFSRILQQTIEFVRGLTLKQKLMVAGGAVLVAGTLYLFVQLIGKPDYKTLYSGLDSRDAESLTAQLKSKNIPFEVSPDRASIQVPADKLDAARLEVASRPLPNSGRLGFELFDKPNWAGSDFSERVNYQRALEAELERTLSSMGEVDAVRVHLVMPTESLYSDRDHVAKASVMLKLRTSRLPEKADTAIRELVAGAVDQLKPENVVVIDADTHLALGGALGSLRGGEDESLDAQLAKKLVATLEPVVGVDGVRASVHVERDLTSGEETQETYDPNSAVALSSSRSEERLGSDSLGGVPGTSSNLPNARPASATKADPQSHTTKTETGTYVVNKTVRHTIQPAGGVRRVAAAVVVDDALAVEMRNGQRMAARRKRSPEEMKQIEELARATLGLDSNRGDLLAIENLSFQVPQAEEPAAPTKVERVQRTLRNFTWLFRYGALACLFSSVYLLLLRPVKKQIIATFRALPEKVAMAKVSKDTVEGGTLAEGEALASILGAGAESDPSLARLSALKKHLVEKVKTEPAGATRLIQNWLHEGGVD